MKVKFFENLEYLSNKINAENNIRLWNPEHWFLTKKLVFNNLKNIFFNKRNIKRNINEQIQYSFLTNFSNCTVNNKLIILIFSSNKNSVVVFLCQMRIRYMEIKLLYSRKKSIMLFVFRSRHMLFYTEQSHGHCNSNQQHQSLHVVVH